MSVLVLVLGSHFYPFHQDAPGFCGFVQQLLQRNAGRAAARPKRSTPRPTCMLLEMLSLSLRISCRFFVPRMFRNVVCANSLGRTVEKVFLDS